MSRFFIILSFIPWGLCYIRYCLNTILEINHRIITFNWFKKSIFKIFRFETLFLFSIFLYFLRYENELVDVMLFAVISLYLLAASFHDEPIKKKGKLFHSNLFMIGFVLLIPAIPFIYYFNTKKLVITYLILFAYLFFARFIVLIANLLYNILPRFRGAPKNGNKNTR